MKKIFILLSFIIAAFSAQANDSIYVCKGAEVFAFAVEDIDSIVTARPQAAEPAGECEFVGTWKFAKISNAEWWANSWMMDVLKLANGADGDSFTLAEEGGKLVFTPNFTGTLKNYFTAPGTATFKGVRNEYLQEEGGFPPPTVEISIYDIENINHSISATDSEIGTYGVGFRLTSDEDTGEEILEMTICDYAPTETTQHEGDMASWKDLYEMMAWSGGDPVMETAPIRIHFKK